MTHLKLPALLIALLAALLGCASAPSQPAQAAAAADSQAVTAAPADVVAAQSSGDTSVSSPLTAQEVLPVDPLVTTGSLANGMRYYIRENDEPRDRAFLRLAVNAGSVLESDDQRGLAHFVEHMAFNGTENYSGNEIIEFLEGLGMQFGPDINAYTSFDETVYQLTVPTDDPETFRQAFSVLLEWADRMTLDTEEIDKERGVIIEEWRSRRSAAQRIAEQQYPVLFAGSRYADRLPIGDVDLIASFPPEAARRFYHDWYRPDLMSVVAVGDFDSTEVEKLITDLFSDFSAPDDAPQRQTYQVPEHPDTRVAIASDPETQYTDVSVVIKRTADELNTREDYRELLKGSLFTTMLNARLDEIARRPDAPFIGAGVSSGRFVRSTSAASLSAAVEGNDVLPALDALIRELRRVTEFGFAETELARAKEDQLRSIEQVYRERENVNSARLADEYVRAYLEGEAIPGIPYERDLHREIVPGITLAEVNELAEAYLSKENRVVLVSAIASDDLPLVTTEDVEQRLALADDAKVTPYEDRVISSELLGELPPPGAVTAEYPLDAENVTVWELSNGVRVIFKPTDYRADQVVFSAFSPGGSSLVADDAFQSAQYATVFVENMGYAEFSPPDLQRVLTGKAVSVTPYIDTTEEGLSGSASAEDLETLMQLIQLKMTAPRVDPDAFAALKRQFQAVVANQEVSPQYQFNREISRVFSLGHPRAMPVNRQAVESIDLQKVVDVYRDRFGDASDFTFLFVGNINELAFRSLVEQYLATLPASGRQESWRDPNIERPDGIRTSSVRAGLDPVSQVAVIFHGKYAFSQENNLAIRSVERALEIRMQEVIREDESGTYGVGVQAQFTMIPRQRYSLIVTFRADPDRVDALTGRLFDVISEVRTSELDPSHIQRVKETLRSGFEEGMTSNQFWLGQIEYALKHDRPMAAIRRYLDLVEDIDAASIMAAARRYLDENEYVQVTLYPSDQE